MDAERFIPTRKSLISRLRNSDDHDGWREFFETYWKLIYSFAVKCGCSDSEAEEVVQETIISVSKKMPDYKYDPAVCSFRGWLMHVTNWRVIDQLRKRDHRLVSKRAARESSTGGLFEQIPDPLEPQLEAIWKQEWERNIIDAAMARVRRKTNPLHYQIFYLHLVKGSSAAAIAKLLGVGKGQIYLAKHRVGALVKKEVKRLEKQML